MATDTKNSHKHSCIKDRGRNGEQETRAIIQGIRQTVPFTLYSNVYLRKDGRNLTEIDFLLVSERGLIAIENKEYGGRITGSYTGYQWTCTYPKKNTGSRSKEIQRRFRNPIRQNRMHIGSMAAKMGIAEDEFFSLIVFPDTATLSLETEKIPGTRVIHRSALPAVITRYFADNTPSFNPALVRGWSSWLSARLV